MKIYLISASSLPVYNMKKVVEKLDSGSNHLLIQLGLCQPLEECYWTGSISFLCIRTPSYEMCVFSLHIRTSWGKKRKKKKDSLFLKKRKERFIDFSKRLLRPDPKILQAKTETSPVSLQTGQCFHS